LRKPLSLPEKSMQPTYNMHQLLIHTLDKGSLSKNNTQTITRKCAD